MPLARKLGKPEWASRIEAIRTKLQLSQVELAKRLGVTQVAVSQWERGRRQPSADQYVKIGRMAHGTERWYFWNRAGFTHDDYRAKLDEMAQHSHSRSEVRIEVMAARGAVSPEEGTRLKKKPDVVAIPLLKDSAAAGSPRAIDEALIEDVLFARSRSCPHPRDTVAFRVEGDSITPVLEDGDTVIVDTAQNTSEDLYGKMVAALGPDGGVTVKWLRLVGKQPMLMPNHTSQRHQPVLLADEPGWKVVGRVISSRREY